MSPSFVQKVCACDIVFAFASWFPPAAELIQTELHHMRTLRIMERVFRQGMLEEVHVEPTVVHAIFPCLDRLTALHGRFLASLLQRRNHSLQPGSTYNFTITQLGDILIEQVMEYYWDA